MICITSVLRKFLQYIALPLSFSQCVSNMMFMIFESIRISMKIDFNLISMYQWMNELINFGVFWCHIIVLGYKLTISSFIWSNITYFRQTRICLIYASGNFYIFTLFEVSAFSTHSWFQKILTIVSTMIWNKRENKHSVQQTIIKIWIQQHFMVGVLKWVLMMF